MDYFHEETIIKANSSMNVFFYYTFYSSMIFFGVLSLLYINAFLKGAFDYMFIILALITGALAYGSYILRNNQRIEYDYTFTNGVLDIAKIINRSKRKKLLSVEIGEFEIIAPIGHESFQKALQDKTIQKRLNYFLNKGEGLYYGILRDERKRCLLIFEPSQEMLRMFKAFNPRNVII